MENQISDVINKADVYVEGIGFIGVATYQSPELKFKKITILLLTVFLLFSCG